MARGKGAYSPITKQGYGDACPLTGFISGVAANGTDLLRLYPSLAAEASTRQQFLTIMDITAFCRTTGGASSTVVVEFHKTDQAGNDLGKIGTLSFAPGDKWKRADVRQNMIGVPLLLGQGIRVDFSGVANTPGADWNITVNGETYGIIG